MKKRVADFVADFVADLCFKLLEEDEEKLVEIYRERIGKQSAIKSALHIPLHTIFISYPIYNIIVEGPTELPIGKECKQKMSRTMLKRGYKESARDITNRPPKMGNRPPMK